MATILVAEDDAHVIRLMPMWLKRGGHEVLEATNGAEAKTIIERTTIDCVVTDINMPHCDGLELVEWMRREAGLKIPVMMLSARCDQARLQDRLALLDVRVYPKPFSPSRLSMEIDAALGLSAVGVADGGGADPRRQTRPEGST